MRSLKEQAKRVGKQGKADFKKKETEMYMRHEHETQAMHMDLRSAGATPDNAMPDDADAAVLERVSKLRLKARQKREKRELKEAHNQRQVQEELGAVGETSRDKEQGALDEVLAGHGLQVYDVPVRHIAIGRAACCENSVNFPVLKSIIRDKELKFMPTSIA
uniref:Uncharacterized protein n=1 Tax=Ulva partita TaxID=1605170 RepID=A0A1C9ZWB3_9CHLO|nr:hypothetical protein [Ulva partita]